MVALKTLTQHVVLKIVHTLITVLGLINSNNVYHMQRVHSDELGITGQ
jgi:hypothetical protein